MSYKYTKIIATLGPASESKTVMKQMIQSGLNIARFNFSHGSYPHHALLMRNFRAVAKELHMPVALIQDLQGPRVRIAKLPDRGIKVVNGERVTFAYKDSMDSSSADIPVDYPLYKHMKPGHRILIQDGLVQLEVTKIQKQTIVTKVTEGGTIYTHKGINIPDTSLTTSALTPKDRKDLIFGLSQKVDFVAISFVEKASDVRLLKRLIHDAKPQQPPKIIVKIERAKAIKNFQEILAETDAIMIARGDLGVDLPAEDVPLLQKDIIKQCLRAGKPVIVATQMLESMIESPRPTRAEASDVANAVIDHTDAIMLSGETAFGKHPVECIKMMHNIAVKTEGSEYSAFPQDFFDNQSQDFVDTLSGALSNFSKQKKLKGIVVLTGDNSFLARVIARRRAEVPVFAVTDNMETYGELVLSWGIYPVYMKVKHRYHLVSAVLKNLKKDKFLKKGDMVALVNNYAKNAPEVTCHEC